MHLPKVPCCTVTAACCLQFAALTSDTIFQVRNCCIQQVLGTDMKKHFDIMSRFQVI